MIKLIKRKKKKQTVYHNNNAGEWNKDEEEKSLLPGSDGYKAYTEQLAVNNPMSNENSNNVADEQLEIPEKGDHQFSQKLSNNLHDAFEKGQLSVGTKINIAVIQRKDMVRQTAKIASEGLGRTITDEEIEDANSGLTVMPEDVPKSLKNYERELNEREIPKVDMNNDGQIDEDDVYTTPGMNKMRKYM